MKKITVLLAEDHMIVREGFRKMLELEDDFEIVGEAQDGRQAVALAKKLHPDVVLMDIAMPLLNGLEATRQIAQGRPRHQGAHALRAQRRRLCQKRHRVRRVGFLLKQTSAHDVCRAIREVTKGENIFQPLHFQAAGPAQPAESPDRAGALKKESCPN
jgi:DNA-binding NarL/FixJ family response regulator